MTWPKTHKSAIRPGDLRAAKYQRPSAGAKGLRSRTKVTDVELAIAAWRAGFGGSRKHGVAEPTVDASNPAQIAQAVAWALAEHRGTVVLDAVGKNTDGSEDLGAWQINSHWWVDQGPRFDRNRLLTDLDYNAAAAYHIFKEQGWSAWKSPMRMIYKRRAAQAVKQIGQLTPSQVATGGTVASGIDDKFKEIGNKFDFDSLAGALWPVLLKTALATTGLALMGWGVVSLFSSSAAGDAVKTVAPAVGAVTGRGA